MQSNAEEYSGSWSYLGSFATDKAMGSWLLACMSDILIISTLTSTGPTSDLFS